MRRLNIFLLLCMVLILTASADAKVFKFGDDVDYKVVCTKGSGYCSGSAQCNATILYPNNTIVVDNVEFSNQNSYHNYTLTTSQLNALGEYAISGICVDSGASTDISDTFIINNVGEELTISRSILYFISMLFMVLIMIVCLYITKYLPSGDMQNDDGEIIQYSQLKHVRPILFGTAYGLFVMEIFIIQNFMHGYMLQSLISTAFYSIFIISFTVLLVGLPLWMVWIWYKMYRDAIRNKLLKQGFGFKEL